MRAIGSIAISLCQVAAGRADGMASLRSCRSVDAAAAQLIVRESGGVVAFSGERRAARARRWPTSTRAPRSLPRARRGRPGAGAGAAAAHDLLGSAERVAGRARRRRRDDAAAATSTRWPRCASARSSPTRALHARSAPLPRPQVVGRDGWARANVRLLRATLGPLDERLDGQAPAPLRAVAGGVIAAEMGALVGYLSRRVLGQYEVALTTEDLSTPPQLYLVAPNLHELARAHRGSARRPAGVGHGARAHARRPVRARCRGCARTSAGSSRELLSSTDVQLDPGGLRAPTLDDARALWDRTREGGLVGAVTGPRAAPSCSRGCRPRWRSSRVTPST